MTVDNFFLQKDLLEVAQWVKYFKMFRYFKLFWVVEIILYVSITSPLCFSFFTRTVVLLHPKAGQNTFLPILARFIIQLNAL